MGGVQVTVSWSTDGLVTVMFPTGPREAGEEGHRGGRGDLFDYNICLMNTHSLS